MIALNDPNCDGWALYDKSFIAGDNPKNIHIVETKVTLGENGKSFSTPNANLVTLCGHQHLVQTQRSCLIATKNENEVRNEIVKLQNNGQEVCGQCAAHMFEDPVGENNG